MAKMQVDVEQVGIVFEGIDDVGVPNLLEHCFGNRIRHGQIRHGFERRKRKETSLIVQERQGAGKLLKTAPLQASDLFGNHALPLPVLLVKLEVARRLGYNYAREARL